MSWHCSIVRHVPQKHVLKLWANLTLLQKIAHFWPHEKSKTGGSKDQITRFGDLMLSIRSLKYLRRCQRLRLSSFLWSIISYEAAIFLNCTFALNPRTRPSGQPRDTAEESAAHHLEAGHTQKTPPKHFLKLWGIFGYFQKLTIFDHMWDQKPESSKSQILRVGDLMLWI